MTRLIWYLGFFLTLVWLSFGLCGCIGSGDSICPIPTEMMSGQPDGYVPYVIRNDACTTFCSINISPTNCDDWGYDWIRGDSLRSGEAITIYLPTGNYDVLLEECTDREFLIERGKN